MWLHLTNRLYGPNVYVDKMKELVESILADGLYLLMVITLLNVNWHFLN